MRKLDYVCKYTRWKKRITRSITIGFEHGTVIHFFGSSRFTQLPIEEQTSYMTKWANSTLLINLSNTLAALKTLYGFSYFLADQDVLHAIGMPPFCAVSSSGEK